MNSPNAEELEPNDSQEQSDLGDTVPVEGLSTSHMSETKPVLVGGEPQIEETANVKIKKPSKSGTPSGETQPVRVTSKEINEGENLVSTSTKKIKRKRPRRWPYLFLGILLIIILGGAGVWLGYQSGIQMRLDQETNDVAMAAVTQYHLGVADQEAGRYEMARERYEYVIRLDPFFPGAQEKLTEVMLTMAETAVPTNAPTITPIPLTPTPDMRSVEEKFAYAQSMLRAGEWDTAIAALEILRKEDLLYRTVDVDGMYYIALRFRGVQKILNGSLEGGIYDLTLSERFGPLDNDAESYRNWARYYLTGSSFWEIDWSQVVQIFGEIYPNLPNLRDGSGWTAQERYRVGSIRFGEELAGQELWCDARYYYAQALALAQDENLAPEATRVAYICEPPTPTPTLTLVVTITPTPTATEDITPTPTATEDLVSICCPIPDPDNPDPRCESYTCPE